MRVYIGPYKNWFGPYQLAEKLCFWAKKTEVDVWGHKDYPDYVFKLGEWFAYGKWRGIDEAPRTTRNEETETWLYKLMQWYDNKKSRKVKVRIDPYDTWSMDTTLAIIILPMLKQLKETKHGSPIVDMEDVPEYMRTTDTPDYSEQLTFDWYNDESDDQKCKCDIHTRWNWVMDEMIWAFEVLNDSDKTWAFEAEEDKRFNNALRLFGKYYRGLWD